MSLLNIILLLCSLAGSMGRPSETSERSRNAGGYGLLRPGYNNYNNYPGYNGYPGHSGYPGYDGYPGQYPGGGYGYPGGYRGYGQRYPSGYGGGYNGYPGGYSGPGYPGYGGYRPFRPSYPGYPSGYGHKPNYFSGSNYPFDVYGDNLSFGRNAGEIKRNLSPTQT